MEKEKFEQKQEKNLEKRVRSLTSKSLCGLGVAMQFGAGFYYLYNAVNLYKQGYEAKGVAAGIVAAGFMWFTIGGAMAKIVYDFYHKKGSE